MPGNPPPVTLEAYSFALNRNLDQVTRNVYQPAMAELENFARREATDRWVSQYQNVQGIGQPTLNRDLETPPQVAPITGYQTVCRQQSFRSQLTVEETMTRVSMWWNEIGNNMQDMATSVLSLKDITMANFFNNGFTNGLSTNIVESDGTARAPFSTGHYYESGNGTFSNYYNVLVPPNPQTIYLIINQYLKTLFDNTGFNYINAGNTFTILTPTSQPSWGLAADEIVASVDRPDTSNRSTNVFTNNNANMARSMSLRHRSLNRLTSSTKWFIVCDVNLQAYPLRLKELEAYSLTPLQNAAPINPHVWMQTNRTQFGGCWMNSYRLIVAIGT